ncbi:MAG: choice-of-anchor Q domain-containing protein, partial [Pedobacter sp.]|jgi:hypothetical protein
MDVEVSHSLIEGGYDGVIIEGEEYAPITLNWLEGNLECDPMVNTDYTPLAGSPLIDAGTLELPEGIELPETDVYGNQRIYGNGIDIGAVEWQGTPVNYDELVQKPMEIMVYPNPLIATKLRDGQARILWSGEVVTEAMQFEIFNLKGQRIRELRIKDEGLKNNTAYWDLRDNAGSQVASGVYFIRMKADGEYKAQRKVVVVN